MGLDEENRVGGNDDHEGTGGEDGDKGDNEDPDNEDMDDAEVVVAAPSGLGQELPRRLGCSKCRYNMHGCGRCKRKVGVL